MKFIKKLFKKHKKEKPKSFLITVGGGDASCDELGKNGESIMKHGKGGGGGSVYVYVSDVDGFVSSGGYAVVNHCYNCDRLEEELKKSKQELESIKNLLLY
jgi:hypothetical protein